jgi:hypothetical protein
MRWDGELRNVYKIFVGKHDGKRQLGRPRRRWKDIRMNVKVKVKLSLCFN